MTIVLLVEGDTEAALKTHLKNFLERRAELENKLSVRLKTKPVVTRSKGNFHRRVQLELAEPDVSAVVALVDVYPDFTDAAEAKRTLREKAGSPPDFYAHAAQHDVEAWLLPFWDEICKDLRVSQQRPGYHPEDVNHMKPPSARLRELYHLAKHPGRSYNKATEMRRILNGKDLTVVADRCPEFKLFLNTLLTLSDLTPLP